MTPITATKKPVRVQAVQYDGTNGPEIAKWAESMTWLYDDGSIDVEVECGGGTRCPAIGHWVVHHYGNFYTIEPDGAFRETYDIEPSGNILEGLKEIAAAMPNTIARWKTEGIDDTNYTGEF